MGSCELNAVFYGCWWGHVSSMQGFYGCWWGHVSSDLWQYNIGVLMVNNLGGNGVELSFSHVHCMLFLPTSQMCKVRCKYIYIYSRMSVFQTLQ